VIPELKVHISLGEATYQLSIYKAPENLRREVKDMRKFYTKQLNPARKGGPMLTLRLCNDTELVLEYITFLKDNWKLKPSTLSRIISVLISIVKFNYGRNSADHSGLPEIIFLRSLQSQLERKNRLLSEKM
jgi:hypothetical protein